MQHPTPAQARGPRPRIASVGRAALLAVLLPQLVSAQATSDPVERARSLAAESPAAALQLLEQAVAAGRTDYATHQLMADVLLRLGRHADARVAITAALDRLARDLADAERLLRSIDKAAATGRAEAAPAGAPDRPTTPPPPGDLDRRRREADDLWAKRQVLPALRAYQDLASSSDAATAKGAKDRLVRVTHELVAQAERARDTGTEAGEEVQQALAVANSLQQDLGDTDRALEAIEPLSRSKDEATRQRAGEHMVDWIRRDVERSNDAHRRNDADATRHFGANTTKTAVKLSGTTSDADLTRRGLEARCDLADADLRRRALEEYAAWAKGQWLLAEAALRTHDREQARRRRDNVHKTVVYLTGRGEDGLAADLTHLMAQSSDRDLAAAGAEEQRRTADDLTARASNEFDAGNEAAAADLWAAVFRADSSRTGAGMRSADLYLQLGRRIDALKLYEQLAHALDQDVAAPARAHIEELQAWATRTFASMRNAFSAAIDGNHPEEAIGLAREPLTLLDRTKLDSIRDAIANGIDLKRSVDELEEMGRQIAQGTFPELPAPTASTANRAGPIDRPPVVGEPFTAALGLGMRPVAGGSFRRPDGTEVQVTQPFWVAERRITEEQTLAYSSFQKWSLGMLSWDGAVRFCLYLNSKEREAGRLPQGYAYTLPTEAEWELLHARDESADAPSGPPTYEWCLDSVDELGKARGVAGDTVDPLSTSGAHRVGRSTDTRQPRRHQEPWHNDFYVRVVLAARPELSPPYSGKK